MRGRLSYQSIPADHPSVVALLAMNPVADPVTLAQMATFGSNTNFDPLVGEQLLYVHVNGADTELFSRNVGTGQIRVFGFESNDDPEARRAGGYLIADIAGSRKHYDFVPEPIVALFAAMADAPWVD